MNYFRCLSLLLFSALFLASQCAPPLSAQTSDGAPPSGEVAPGAPSGPLQTSRDDAVEIPGPLHSFLRMAGISQKVAPDEVLPFLARNVVVRGYVQSRPDKQGKPTEFLLLIRRYLTQARELQELATADGIIRVTACKDASTDRLLQTLGYRLSEPCGPNTLLVTTDADRAFLTIDSGFPLVDLEEALRGGPAFSYDSSPSYVPVLFGVREWEFTETGEQAKDVLDALLSYQALARLYWSISRTDSATAAELYKSLGLKTLVRRSAALDFYGTHIYIRNGRLVVPGGAAAERAWASLVGAKPENPSAFVDRLLTRDEGWLAAYFDALASAGREQQAYFTQQKRLERNYMALRQPGFTPGAARSSFRPNPSLVLLATRLYFDGDGEPHVPGGLEAWKEIVRGKSDSKIERDWGKKATGWDSPDELIEGMCALSRSADSYGPLALYLQLNEIDRHRSPEKRLSAATVHLLDTQFSRFGNQYRLFSEFGDLDDASIVSYLSVAQTVDRISNHSLRANVVGLFQSNVSLFEILARQGQLPAQNLNQVWQAVVSPFSEAKSSVQLFDAAHASFTELISAAAGKRVFNEDDVIALLAGPVPQGAGGEAAETERVHRTVQRRIRGVLDDQRLVSLDTLFALADGLNSMSQGKAVPSDMMLQLVGEIREFEMPRAIFTSTEKAEWSSGQIDNAHIALQARTDLMKVFESTGSPAAVAEARGELAPFLRDTLVGLNYAYFEPPGDQVLHNNPLFVRSHDFSGDSTLDGAQSWQTPQLFGIGEPAGGGGHLAGSLADLPYVLAESDQDFVVPENVQALVWEEMVPSLLLSASLPRWWGISRNELHAVTLYQRAGEEYLVKAATDAMFRERTLDILSDRIPPQRLGRIESSLVAGHTEAALAAVTPADTFYVAAQFRSRFPDAAATGAAGKELQQLANCCAQEVSAARLAHDFGAPHPILANSYSNELLNVKSFVSFVGLPSRLLAESWESNNLYWARLVDEKGLPPVVLNQLVPQLTLRMSQKIFATDIEDWPAILRAMRETGEEFRKGRLPSLAPAPSAARDQQPTGQN
jgi:hypothetical protein